MTVKGKAENQGEEATSAPGVKSGALMRLANHFGDFETMFKKGKVRRANLLVKTAEFLYEDSYQRLAVSYQRSAWGY